MEVTRLMCASKVETKLLKTPVLGSKKHAKPSNTVRPSEHTMEIHPVVTPPEIHYMKSVAANEVTLPDNEDESACKKPSNLNRFYERTAGIMALVRLCGEFCRDVCSGHSLIQETVSRS